MNEKVVIEKLVHGGQGLATLADGRRVFVWNALPGEEVAIKITKSKRSHCEAIAKEIIKASPHRQQPKDDTYLSTSPWQILELKAENNHKKQILSDAFEREKVTHGDVSMFTAGDEWHYRNKMEYSFWGDENGLHLALFQRGSHYKSMLKGSSIARPEIDKVAQKICSTLDDAKIRASQLKTVVIRCNSAGEVAVALFVKDEKFVKIGALEEVCKGVVVYFSNPKSPASVATKRLYKFGDITLTDKVHGKDLTYDVNSFFQVNLPVFDVALDKINESIVGDKNKIDLYSGVGTIALVADCDVLIESSLHNIEMAKHNTSGKKIELVHASAERAPEYITNKTVVIVDPPRAGLHKSLVERINDVKPPKLVYLSCNPSTQARDVAMLLTNYELVQLEGFNFFPHTPHIESLAIMVRRK